MIKLSFCKVYPQATVLMVTLRRNIICSSAESPCALTFRNEELEDYSLAFRGWGCRI